MSRLPFRQPPRRSAATLSSGPMRGTQFLADVDLAGYLPVVLILLMAITFAVANLVITRLLGPSRSGEVKGATYESGVNPVGTARKRFNVRFYLIAVVFLVFDVEIVFLYPWAATFTNLKPGSEDAAVWLGRIMFFLATTVVAYLYGWRKGVFKFD
jgi:NADH-quinone oxidoreductase subunit A